MPPVTSRKIFIWSLPALFLLSFLWYKRKKGLLRSDPGGTDSKSELEIEINSSSGCRPAKVEATIIAEVHSVLHTSISQEAENKIIQKLIFAAENSAVVSANIEEAFVIAAAETSEEKDREKSFLVSEIVPESDQLSLQSSDSLKPEDNIVVELICEVEEIPLNTASTLNSDAPDIDVENISIVPDVAISNQSQSSSNCCTDKTALCSDLEYFDKIPIEELIAGISVIPTLPTIVSYANTSNIQVSLVSKEEEEEVKVIPEVQEEPTKVEQVDNFAVNQSWAEECDLDTEKEEMAREVSSDITLEVSRNSTLEGTAVEDDTSVNSLQVEVASLECKLSSLEMEAATGAVDRTSAIKEGSGAERDSANHSPAEVMLGSPSLSNYSDSQSEGSSDSGKGCSDVVTPPSRTPASGSSVSGDLPVSSVFEFVLPQFLVGRLIGRHGAFVNQIKAKTHANILIKRHPETNKFKICAIEGAPIDIESALEMIRQKFPLKRYPNVTLEQVSFVSQSTYPLLPENFQLQLVEGVNNDVILSSLISPAHFFLQQPTHPTYPSLNRLNVCMNYCYNEPLAPALPTPIADSVVCVAPTMGGWYRAQVVASDPETEMSLVKFVDYGGFLTVENSLLRQIRSDFIVLPFQAVECYLANVKPIGGVWACEAMALVEELTHGQVIQAQIHGYAEDGMPVVYLFSIQGTQVLVVNRELVLRGYAEWDEPTEEAEPVVEIEA